MRFQGSKGIVAAVFGSVTTLALLSLLGLRETSNKPLPQTVRAAMETESYEYMVLVT